MKKASIIFASVALLGSAALTSCVQDTQPRIDTPTEFVLNVPQMSQTVYCLSSDVSIDLSWSQPDYGLGVVPTYSILISENSSFKSFYELPYTFSMAHVSFSGSEFDKMLQDIKGWDANTVPTEPMQLYVRIKSEIPNYPLGTIMSNIIPLSVLPYYIVTDPDQIWLIGQCQGWNIASADGWALNETEIGSRIYKGVFDIPAGEFQFRFYDKLGNWESYSIGSQDADEPIDISMASGEYSGPCFYDPNTDKAGKGSWKDPDWAGGKLTITVDLNNLTVSFISGAVADEIYIVGSCNSWDINSGAMKLVESPAGSRVYKGTVNIPADQFLFRFYDELGDWETNIIGCAEVAGDEDYAIPGLPYDGACVAGSGNEFKGKWSYEGWTGGDVDMTVDLNTLTVSFVAQ